MILNFIVFTLCTKAFDKKLAYSCKIFQFNLSFFELTNCEKYPVNMFVDTLKCIYVLDVLKALREVVSGSGNKVRISGGLG